MVSQKAQRFKYTKIDIFITKKMKTRRFFVSLIKLFFQLVPGTLSETLARKS